MPTYGELRRLQRRRPQGCRQARDGPVSRPADFDLDADEIVSAAVEIFRESGLDAVSMRSVASRLGVSPVRCTAGSEQGCARGRNRRSPLREPLPRVDDETWDCYATRWATALRSQLARRRRVDSSSRSERGIRGGVAAAGRRNAATAFAPMRGASVSIADGATVGFVAVESGPGAEPAETSATGRRRGRHRRRGKRVVRHPHPTPHRRIRRDIAPKPCAAGAPMTIRLRDRQDRGCHRGQQGPGRAMALGFARPAPTWWSRVEGSRRARSSPTRSERSDGARFRCDVTWATGTSARRSSTRRSPSSAASTCSSTTRASLRFRHRCST